MLVGWRMLSAERYPIVLYGPLRLPSIVPHNVALYAWLRSRRQWDPRPGLCGALSPGSSVHRTL
jgi:hypothetical protein